MRSLTMAAIGITAALLSVASSAQIIQQGNALVITSPSSGTVVTPGETITVSVIVNSGTYPNGIAIIGGEAAGPGVTAGPLSGPSPSFSVTIPPNADSGPFAISANGIDSSGNFDSSFQVTLDVEQSGSPVSLRVDPPSIHFQGAGQSLPLTVIGVYANGSWQGLSQSSLMQMTSNNTAIATVQNGTIVASSPGNADIQVSYGSLAASVPVYVAQTTSLSANQSLDVNLNVPGQSASFTFSLTGDGSAGIGLSSISTSPTGSSVFVAVYNSSGTLVNSATVTTDSTLSLSGLGGGTYTVIITAPSAGTASLQMSLAVAAQNDMADAPLPAWAYVLLGAGLLAGLTGAGRRAA